MIYLKLIIGIYAVFTLVASFQMYKENGERVNILTGIVSFIMVITAIFAGSKTFSVVGIGGLLYYQVAAIWQGMSHHNFHWQHHAVRLVLTCILIAFLIYFR
ncbi:hypothetical protein D3P96_01820 [Weissella viridescens]|uniref:Uncharacterized protein n=1 Tax=Weissella viridescens TaxID=1629 RepID=A0A3P2RGR7_WEIVI|nr:hypothetical protein [Weissella viridescens]RRG18746.1 hypothetical protein D3P96_01820 [Weissella viridescens]